MTIISILLAFLCDRYQGFQQIKRYHWLSKYAQKCLQVLTEQSTTSHWWAFALMLLPLILVMVILQTVLHHAFYGLAGLIFNVFVLVYCLGSRGISEYFFSIFFQKNETVLIEGEVTPSDKPSVESVVANVHQEIFAIIFWFILLGAVGAVLYRCMIVFKQESEESDSRLAPYQQMIQWCKSVLDWPSIRVLALCLSLGGAFSRAFTTWWQEFLTGLSNNETFLKDCALAAADASNQEEVQALLHRSILIFLVILALMTLASWVA